MGSGTIETSHHLMAIKRSPVEWESILKELDDSGMSLASFCAERRLRPGKGACRASSFRDPEVT